MPKPTRNSDQTASRATRLANSGLSLAAPHSLITKSAGSKTVALTKAKAARSTFGPSGSIRSNTKAGEASRYPIVAPNYAAQRSDLAKSLGLGRKGGMKAAPKKAAAKRASKKSAAAA